MYWVLFAVCILLQHIELPAKLLDSLEIIIDLPIGFPINNIISLSFLRSNKSNISQLLVPYTSHAALFL